MEYSYEPDTSLNTRGNGNASPGLGNAMGVTPEAESEQDYSPPMSKYGVKVKSSSEYETPIEYLDKIENFSINTNEKILEPPSEKVFNRNERTKQKDHEIPAEEQVNGFYDFLTKLGQAWLDIITDLFDITSSNKSISDIFTKDDRLLGVGVLMMIIAVFMIITRFPVSTAPLEQISP